MVTNTYLSIMTLNVNGLNNPIKGSRIAKWIRKPDPDIQDGGKVGLQLFIWKIT